MVTHILVEFVVSPIKPQSQILFHFTTTSTLPPITRPFTVEELLEEVRTPLQSQVVVLHTMSFRVILQQILCAMLVIKKKTFYFSLILYWPNFFFHSFFYRRCEWSVDLWVCHLKHWIIIQSNKFKLFDRRCLWLLFVFFSSLKLYVFVQWNTC